MNRGRLLILSMFLLVLFSCEIPPFHSYEEDALEPYDGSMTWEKVVDKAPFSRRYDHASVTFDEKLWVIGGYDPTQRGQEDGYREDVWSSIDGSEWTLVTDDAPWKGRRGHAVAVLDGYIYLSGGFSVDGETGERGYCRDVWRSSDGEEWVQLTSSAAWGKRMNHAMVASGDTLYLFGGMKNGITYYDDMWESSDGVTWTQVTDGTLPGRRAAFAAVSDDEGVIYLMGGSYEDIDPDNSGSIDPAWGPGWEALWTYDPSATSPVWTQGATPRWKTGMRAEFSLSFLDDTMINLSGRANSSYRFSRDTSTYSLEMYEGSSWHTDSLGPPLPPRYSYSTAVQDIDGIEYLYVIGGIGDNGPENDVYRGTLGGAL